MTVDPDQRQRVTLEKYLMDTINERDRKYEQRFTSLDKSLSATNDSIKEALAVAILTTKEALQTATANTRDALAAANVSIERMGDTIEQKVQAEMRAAKEAVLKAENATEKRFELLNEFRAQMGDMQAKLVPKTEVDIRFAALDEKINLALGKLQVAEGQGKGSYQVWMILVTILTLLIGGTAIAISLQH